MIETRCASRFGVKSTIGIEKCALDDEAEVFQSLESPLQVGFEVKGIMMITSNNARRGNNVALGIGDGQDVGCFGAFAGLVANRYSPFLAIA